MKHSIISVWEHYIRYNRYLQIFQSLENPNEVETLETYKALLLSKRKIFLNSVWNVTSGKNSEKDLDSLLLEYEVVVEQAVDNGIDILTQVSK